MIEKGFKALLDLVKVEKKEKRASTKHWTIEEIRQNTTTVTKLLKDFETSKLIEKGEFATSLSKEELDNFRKLITDTMNKVTEQNESGRPVNEETIYTMGYDGYLLGRFPQKKQLN